MQNLVNKEIRLLNIPLITLNNGVKMPQLGLGVYLVPHDQTAQIVTTALKDGYRLIDTAAAYHNEEGVGKAIRNCGIPREEIFVTTKLWNTNHGYDNAIKGFEASLNELDLDYLDLYLIHWPNPQKGLAIETWKALEQVYKEGRVKAIGVCNFTPEHLNHLLQETEVIPAVLQIEIHPFFTQEKVRKYAKDHGIQVESWYPLGGHRNKEKLLNLPLFTELAKKYNKTPAQIILRWHTQLGLIVIPKSSNPDRIKENGDIFDFEMNHEEIASISDLDTGIRLGPDPDIFTGE
jgi:diketogulonate reductase-like aldo/keto reductase